jgi:cyclic beta-1,2-glucan synthetase
MEFGFLYDAPRALFAIGYQLTSTYLDTSHYDLLASEARLASFVAIAKNDVPVEHWFHLGRELTRAAGAYRPDVLERDDVRVPDAGAGDAVVPLHPPRPDLPGRRAPADRVRPARGRALGDQRVRYNLRDHAQTYQYRTFGVPDLALKRGLDADLVVAPMPRHWRPSWTHEGS